MNIFTKTVVKVLVVFYLYIFFVPSVFAVSTRIIDFPNTIGSDPFTIIASVSGAMAGTNYLRIDLYKEGTTNYYFGETYNGSTWISGSNGTEYFPITISSDELWSGSFQGRLGSPTSTEYNGSGSYKLRIRRYTASGNPASSTEANDSVVSIEINTPPTVVPTTESTSAPTNPSSVTSVPTPAPTSPPTSTPKPPTATAKPTTKPTIKPTTAVLAAANKKPSPATASPSATPTKAPEKKKVSGNTVVATFFTGFGLILLTFCGILGFRIYKERKNDIYGSKNDL